MTTTTKQRAATLLPGSSDQVCFRPDGMPEHCDLHAGVIIPGRYQPRTVFDDAGLQELAGSITAHGILTRLKVFWNGTAYELIAGERRLRAAQLAGLDSVPVELCEYTLRQIHEISILDNLQRADLSPQEEGASFERLITELGISEAELARRLGKNRGYIQQRRALATAPAALQEAFTKGLVSFSHVRGLLAGAPDRPDDQVAALDAALRRLQYQKLSEEECRSLAEEKVAGSIEREVRALGWSVARPSGLSGKAWLYDAGHRPRTTSIAELVRIVTEQRRPDPATAEAVGEKLTREEEQLLTRCDRRFNTYSCPPWLKPDGSKGGWISPAELRATVLPECQRLADDLAARLTALGYRLTTDGHYYWQIYRGDQLIHKYLSWDTLNRETVKLETAPPADVILPAIPPATVLPTQIGGPVAQEGGRLIDILAGTALQLPPRYLCDVDTLRYEIVQAFLGSFAVQYPTTAALLRAIVTLNGGTDDVPAARAWLDQELAS